MHVGEAQELVPIKWRDCMSTSMNVICDRVHDRVIEIGHLVGTKILRFQQLVDWASAHAREELTLRISPTVSFSTGNVNGSQTYHSTRNSRAVTSQLTKD
jgi:hypothetical protein